MPTSELLEAHVSGESPFARRDFRFLLFGQTASQFGAQISGVAIPLLAVLTLHASPWQLGVVNASSTIAFALIGLPAGVWLDRLRRRRVLVISDLARTILLTSIPLAAWQGRLSITHLIVVSLLAGVARVFFDVGYQSYLPTLLGPGRVLAGNSAMETARASGQFAGPGLGGWLVGLVGAANVVAIQAATFAVSALSLLAIRTPEPAPPRSAERPRLSAQVREGLTFVLRNRVLGALALASALANFAFAVASAVTIIFLSRTLELPPSAIGLVVAVGSIAVVIGAAATPRLSRRFGSARIIWLSLAVTGPVAVLGPLAQPGWWVLLIVVGGAAGELGQIVYAITSLSLRQRLCPGHILGRVNATMRFLIMGVFPLGALVGGMLGELAGLRVTLFVSQGLIVLSALPVYLVLRHTRDIDDLAPW
ncbi:MFS transporter [Phytoactinopolyspora alkaliphila]|uniref:MFS transporter n=1 Tax=Phytoactinopolyspora alkaliphila TaxID=1783498 RepID=A0A6N9YHJ5_9ACTN|nr:MFS transporter [Phytoactinopolyspora alkaliphila]NED94476.1 MFS transporter [Phytoactinopolyspora alkaliphila]